MTRARLTKTQSATLEVPSSLSSTPSSTLNTLTLFYLDTNKALDTWQKDMRGLVANLVSSS